MQGRVTFNSLGLEREHGDVWTRSYGYASLVCNARF